jgi:hypothetical protein
MSRKEHDRRMLAAAQESQERYLREEAGRPSYDRHWSVLDPGHAVVAAERNIIQAYLSLTILQGVCQFGWSFLEVLLCMHSLIIWRC